MAAFVKCFTIGQLVRLSAEFSDIDRELVDPDNIEVRVLDPNEDETSKNYPFNSDVIRDDAGLYHYDVDARIAGKWRYRWSCTGQYQSAAEGSFTINASEFSQGSP